MAERLMPERLMADRLTDRCLALPGRAQGYDPADVASQQQQMQGLIDGALLGILNANLQAFQALYPSNNWADLQMSLQDSGNSCQAKGR
jgi:hypothetical protein